MTGGVGSFLRRRVMVVVLVVSLVVLGVGVWWRQQQESNEDSMFVVPELACGIFSVERIEEIAGRKATWYELRRNKTSIGDLDLSCTLGLEGFADIRIAYLDKPWFRSRTDVQINEDDFRSFPEDYQWPVEELDLGLDGHTYVTVVGQRGGTLAYAVWYSPSGRTFSLVVFNGITRSESSLTDEEVRATTVALFSYLAEEVQAEYPAAGPGGTPTENPPSATVEPTG